MERPSSRITTIFVLEDIRVLLAGELARGKSMEIWRKRNFVRSAILAIATVSVMLFSGYALGAPTLAHGALSVPVGGLSGQIDTSPVGHAPSSVGLANGHVLEGPRGLVPTPLSPGQVVGPAGISSHATTPSPNKPGLDARTTGTSTVPISAGPLAVPPNVTCMPVGPGCDTISLGGAGATTDPFGINAFNNDAANGQTVEPPDQGMCAGNGFVVEIENLGELQILGENFHHGSAIITLDNLMGLTGLGWSSGGDIQCLYDQGNGGHWFITEIVSESSEANGGAFTGCFAGILDGCLEGLSVSVTDNPTGAWNTYFVEPNSFNSDPGVGYFLNDFAKDATTQNAFLMFYDEFNFNGSTVPRAPPMAATGSTAPRRSRSTRPRWNSDTPWSSQPSPPTRT